MSVWGVALLKIKSLVEKRHQQQMVIKSCNENFKEYEFSLQYVDYFHILSLLNKQTKIVWEMCNRFMYIDTHVYFTKEMPEILIKATLAPISIKQAVAYLMEYGFTEKVKNRLKKIQHLPQNRIRTILGKDKDIEYVKYVTKKDEKEIKKNLNIVLKKQLKQIKKEIYPYFAETDELIKSVIKEYQN